MSQIRNIQLLLGIVGVLLLFGCQNNSVEPAGSEQETTVQLIPMTTRYVDIQRMGTRGYLPDGYVPYDDLYSETMPPNRTIGVFLTPEKENSLGNFTYEGKDGNGISFWKSTVMVKVGHDYYIYGFMPREEVENPRDVNISALEGNYANGATLYINNFKTLTAADVCAVVGVRNATAIEMTNGPEANINLGKFYYKGKPTGENHIFVLLKHLYAGIHFKAFIGSKYHKMRDIEITGLKLEAQNIPNDVDLTLTFTTNDTNTNPLVATYDLATETGTQTVTLFPYEGSTPYKVKEVGEDPTQEGFLGCFVPGQPDPAHPLTFVLHTTYNVYDRVMEMENGVPVLDSDGKPKYINHLIREGCVANNLIDPSTIPGFDAIGAGDAFTVNLLIEPDYLYVLSDPDLDNPTIKITTP